MKSLGKVFGLLLWRERGGKGGGRGELVLTVTKIITAASMVGEGIKVHLNADIIVAEVWLNETRREEKKLASRGGKKCAKAPLKYFLLSC